MQVFDVPKPILNLDQNYTICRKIGLLRLKLQLVEKQNAYMIMSYSLSLYTFILRAISSIYLSIGWKVIQSFDTFCPFSTIEAFDWNSIWFGKKDPKSAPSKTHIPYQKKGCKGWSTTKSCFQQKSSIFHQQLMGKAVSKLLFSSSDFSKMSYIFRKNPLSIFRPFHTKWQ